MSTEPKRYAPNLSADGYASHPGVDPQGEYVRYSDYSALARSRDDWHRIADERSAALNKAYAEIDTLRAQLRASEEKAANWDALMHCRMRTLGGAKLTDESTPYSYLVLELWTAHPEPTDQPWLAELFAAFMVKARAAALQSTPQLAKNEGEKHE